MSPCHLGNSMKIGDKVTFKPHSLLGETPINGVYLFPHTVTGRIVGIHIAHRYCRVEYSLGGGTFYECFKILKRSGGRKFENDSGNQP